MNVYIYGGNSRQNATESVILDNQKAQTGQNYTIDVSDGMLLIAYPNQNA